MRHERSSPDLREEAERTKLFLDHLKTRSAIKDVHEYVRQSPAAFPNRERVLRLVEELLNLIPPVSEEDEEIDERRRAMDRGEIRPYTD
jgi:hypothetical protein